MELLKRNIHMDRICARAVTQFTLEDDMNLPESKPDVNVLNLEKGDLVIEEIKPSTDAVTVRGCLVYKILYHTLDGASGLVVVEGRIPFEEKMNLQGASNQDNVSVEGVVEDITAGMIHSRKLNIQALVTMSAKVEDLYDEEVPIEIHGDEQVEYCKKPLNPAQIALCKKDVFRLRQEVSIPANYPNIQQILWSNVVLGDVEFKVQEERIVLSGDVQLFVLYESEGEDHSCRTFETMQPFNGVLECPGCRDGMFPDIRYKIAQQEIAVRPDFDGEERSIGLELMLEIEMHLYQEERIEVVTDIYGVSKEIGTTTHKANLRRLLTRVTGKTKVTDRIRVKNGTVLQLWHSEGNVTLEQKKVVENGILLQGSIQLKIIFITGRDENPYGCTRAVVPYSYLLEVPGITTDDLSEVCAEVEQLQVSMLDGEEMDVKAILRFSTVVFQQIPMDIISQVNVTELDYIKMSGMPGIVIYMVKSGDNLWNIGKKYYVPVETLRLLNDLDGDELKVGQKLLIVKGY